MYEHSSSLLQKMAHDLRTTISPVYPSFLQQLLALLPRTISALALTSLLETLSSLSGYLLILAVNPNLLKETWNKVSSVLPKCSVEIQRAITEVWGGVLRKLKPGPREEAKKECRDAEDASVWVVVFASQVPRSFNFFVSFI